MITVKFDDMTAVEVLSVLEDIRTPDDPEIVTGHGGFVVPPSIAYRFLDAYMKVQRKPADPNVIVETFLPDDDETDEDDEDETEAQQPPVKAPARKTTRSTARRYQ